MGALLTRLWGLETWSTKVQDESLSTAFRCHRGAERFTAYPERGVGRPALDTPLEGLLLLLAGLVEFPGDEVDRTA